MDLPVMPPVKPMLAKATKELPLGELLYEPKWDGFRCIVFRDGDEVELGSRNERPFSRYFPELLDPIRSEMPARCVIDGEVVVPGVGGGLDFNALQQRIHPAESRVNMLAAKTPASFVAFDLLALGSDDLRSTPFSTRRELLEAALAHAQPPIHLTPATTDPDVASDWFDRFEGAGLDGVIAKPMADPYVEDKRTMAKVKPVRTADCAVADFRWHKSGDGVGSLLLGLHDDEGRLNHVGVSASFTAARRVELVEELAPYRNNALNEHPWRDWIEHQTQSDAKMPGGFSRWNVNKDLSFEPIRLELVAEVIYDQLTSGRFRRTARFLRWRPDKTPAECGYDQLIVAAPIELTDFFAS